MIRKPESDIQQPIIAHRPVKSNCSLEEVARPIAERDERDRTRAVGCDDRDSHDICASTGYYAFVNRTADGWGVEPEPRFARGAGG